jgi:hypothetical protein
MSRFPILRSRPTAAHPPRLSIPIRPAQRDTPPRKPCGLCTKVRAWVGLTRR